MEQIPVFDGHNDLLLRLWRDPARRAEIVLTGEGRGHLDLPRMAAGGFAGGLFAIYVPAPPEDALGALPDMGRPPYDLPLPGPLDPAYARAVALDQAGLFHWIARASGGAFRACTSAAGIRAARAEGAIAGVLHMEGAEAIGPDLDALHVFHAVGLRSLGPVWSRPTVFGHGVPFRFPGDPDTGPGLTDAGRALLRECDALRVMIDLSHLNAQGFRDVMAVSSQPLVATHSNAHALCPSTRNLTDWQLDAIRETGGMVGLNFGTVFLTGDGAEDPGCGFDPMLRHLDHLIARLGEDKVGFGSDFDGVTVPDALADAAGLPRLLQAMAAHGYGAALIRRIAHDNWVDLLGRIWGE